MGHTDIVLNRLKRNFIDNQVSLVYEQICQEKLWSLSAEGTFPGLLERVRRWWDNAHEIDVVGLSEADQLLVLGECKFWAGPVGINVLTALEQKAAFVDWHKETRTTMYILFSIHGFSEDLRAAAAVRKDILLIS